MSLIEAKMRFIQAWQSLPEFGITHFLAKYVLAQLKKVCLSLHFLSSTHFYFKVNSLLCRFQGGKREELIGITYNRLIRMDAGTGDAIKTWRFSNMKQWNVNWEIKMVATSLNITVFLEYYIYFLEVSSGLLSLRVLEASQELEQLVD